MNEPFREKITPSGEVMAYRLWTGQLAALVGVAW
jgi:hypothetical protein